MMGGLALAFSFQAGVLHTEVGSQALSTAKSTEKLQETCYSFGVSMIQSDSVFWSGTQDSSFSPFCCISFFLLLDVRLKLKRQVSGLVPTCHGSAHDYGSAA